MVGTLDINNAYMEMLGSLSNEDKLDLISKLVKLPELLIENWR